MRLLIDTYNLLHAALGPAGAGRDLGYAGLATLVRQSRYGSASSISLVCDGVGPRTGLGERVQGCRIIPAGAGADADSVIESMIARDSDPRRLIVVSSDRRVLSAAKKRAAKVRTSEDFLREILGDRARTRAAPVHEPHPRESVPLPRRQVDHWIGILGMQHDPIQNVPASSEPPRRTGEPDPHVAPAPPAPAPPQATVPDDPVLLRLLRASSLMIDPAELDMRRWLDPPG